jgi:hypothetical protein
LQKHEFSAPEYSLLRRIALKRTPLLRVSPLLDRAWSQGGADQLVRLVAGIKTALPNWAL